MKKRTLLFLLIILLSSQVFLQASVFDQVIWQFDKIKNTISLYLQKNKESKINYYKAEVTVKDIQLKNLLNNIKSFHLYNEIFDRTKYFKKLKDIGPNHYLVCAELNFFPYKNRYYYIECTVKEKEENSQPVYIIEWYPMNEEKYNNFIVDEPKAKRVDFIHGRWTIKEQPDHNIFISLEYHNNWETNLPFSWVTGVEKVIILKNLTSMLDYTREHQ